MISDESRKKLAELNFDELADAVAEQERNHQYDAMSFSERMDRAVDYVWQIKYNNKVKRLLSRAKIRFSNANIVDIYYVDRELDRDKMTRLAACQFIDTNTNVVFQGFTGSGKSWLACCIGKEACKKGYSVRYIRMPDLLTLFEEVADSKAKVAKLLKRFESYSLLILDEFLLNDLSPAEQLFLFELIERRYDKSSTIFCTQYRLEDWIARLGGGVHADAIFDRIVHNVEPVFAGKLNMREIESIKR